jgi:hypothetical protein
MMRFVRTWPPIAWLFLVLSLLLTLVTFCAAGVTFSGVNEKLDMNIVTPFDFPNTNFSVCFWFQSSTAALTAAVSKKPNTAGQGWTIQVNLTSAKLSGIIKDASGTSTVQRDTGATVINDGTERHVCAVFVTNTTTAINNDVTMYVNGVVDQGARGSSTLPYAVSTNSLLFGRRDTGNTLAGSLNDIRLDSPALSASEILHLAKSKIRGGGQLAHKAALHLPLNDCAGSAAIPALAVFKDRSGSGHDGEMNTTGAVCRHGTGLMGAEGVQ